MQIQPAEARLARTSAIVGGIGWGLLLFVRTSATSETELINRILFLGVLVIVPLGLSLLATPELGQKQPLPYRLAVIAQPCGAAAATSSFFLEQGIGAALLAAMWLLVAGLIALYGLWRLLRQTSSKGMPGGQPVPDTSAQAMVGRTSRATAH